MAALRPFVVGVEDQPALVGRPGEPDYRPFCSRRCADVDLQRWLTNRYAVPAEEEDEGARDADFDDE